MKELLIFRVDDSNRIEVLYKDRDMKDFVNVCITKSKDLSIAEDGEIPGIEINTNILEYIMATQYNRLEDVRPELCKFIKYLLANQEDNISKNINTFINKYLNDKCNVGDSHIVKFDKKAFIYNAYFKFEIINGKVYVSCYYKHNDRELTCYFVNRKIDDFNKDGRLNMLERQIVYDFIKNYKLNFNATKFINEYNKLIKEMYKYSKLSILSTRNSLAIERDININDIL